MSIFQRGTFILNSSNVSRWKLELDDATDEEIATFAYMAIDTCRVPCFGSIVPVPKGKSASKVDNAKRIADAMQRYVIPDVRTTLIVDDVFTTGGSINQCREGYAAQHPGIYVSGFVIFARSPTFGWVNALFTMGA